MPHLQIECCPKFNLGPLTDALVTEFCKIETVEPASVKAYYRYSEWFVGGEGAPNGFVHLTICVLSGRSPEILKSMSDRLYEVGIQHLAGQVLEPISWTVEVREMDRDTYRKGVVS
ncbi:MAG: hypothetical protein KDC26_10135 [Armatimonadetes bacterium]|nr:hypothetical protein [Armatimonadota bacterium]